MNTTLYWNPSRKGGMEFTKLFYDLGLQEKYDLVKPYINTFDLRTLERLANAFLQHSEPDTRKQFPVQREHKLSSLARQADLTWKEQHA